MSTVVQTDFLNRVKANFFDYFEDTEVLEIGLFSRNNRIEEYFDNPKLYEYRELKDANIGDVDVYFDAVIVSGNLEQNIEWEAFFKNLFNVAKKGALIVILTTPNDTLTEVEFKEIIEKQDIGSWHLERNSQSTDMLFMGIKAID